MENDSNLETNKVNWMGLILLSAVVGLTLGAGLWFWQSSADPIKDKQSVSGNVNNRVGAENTKPLVLENNATETNSQLELIGDKLSEVSFHLREQQIDAASQTLAEANELALKSGDDPQLQQNLLNGIKQVHTDLKNGKTNEAEQEINSLLNQLNMPEN